MFGGNNAKRPFWPYVGDRERPVVIFDYTPTREPAGPEKFLEQYRGYLQADAYVVCGSFFTDPASGLVEVSCWAHTRRQIRGNIWNVSFDWASADPSIKKTEVVSACGGTRYEMSHLTHPFSCSSLWGMVIEIDVQPGTEQLLKQQLASGRFVSVDEIIRRGIQSDNQPPIESLLRKPLPTTQERAAAFLAWSQSLPMRGFYLPDEALERESFYRDPG